MRRENLKVKRFLKILLVVSISTFTLVACNDTSTAPSGQPASGTDLSLLKAASSALGTSPVTFYLNVQSHASGSNQLNPFTPDTQFTAKGVANDSKNAQINLSYPNSAPVQVLVVDDQAYVALNPNQFAADNSALTRTGLTETPLDWTSALNNLQNVKNVESQNVNGDTVVHFQGTLPTVYVSRAVSAGNGGGVQDSSVSSRALILQKLLTLQTAQLDVYVNQSQKQVVKIQAHVVFTLDFSKLPKQGPTPSGVVPPPLPSGVHINTPPPASAAPAPGSFSEDMSETVTFSSTNKTALDKPQLANNVRGFPPNFAGRFIDLSVSGK